MLHCNVKPDERVTVWNAPDGHDFLTIKILQTPDVLRPRLDIRPWRHNQRCHSGAQYIVVPLIGLPHRRPSNCNRHALIEREGEIHDTEREVKRAPRPARHNYNILSQQRVSGLSSVCTGRPVAVKPRAL